MSSEDVMLTIEIGSTDVAIFYIILFCGAIVLLVIAALSHCHTNDLLPVGIQETFGCHLIDSDDQLKKIVIYFLQLWVLFSDICLAYTITFSWHSTGDNNMRIIDIDSLFDECILCNNIISQQKHQQPVV